MSGPAPTRPWATGVASLQGVFGTAPLPALLWPALLLGPLALLAVDELLKWKGRRRAARLARARA